MSAFEDFIPGDDTHDTSPPDPEAVARILWADLRARAPKRFKVWDAHTRPERVAIIGAVADLLARLRDEGGL